MLKVLTCDGGGSVTCSILEVGRILDRDPSDIEAFGLFWLPLLTAIATIAALGTSLWIARGARRQAEKSELARVDAEKHRLENEQQRRFTDAIANLLDCLPDLIRDFREYERALRKYERLTEARMRAKKPLLPSAARAVVRINAVNLEGSFEARSMLEVVRKVATRSTDITGTARARKFTAISDLLVRWHHGTHEERDKVVDALNAIVAPKTEAEVAAVLKAHGFPGPSALESAESPADA